jgi:tetratricopeptide (TPR) repeat protein
MENAQDRMVVYVRIGEANWQSGDAAEARTSFEKALAIVDSLPRGDSWGDDPREFNRANLAEARARVGDIEGAQSTVAEIKEDRAKWMALFDIALAQASSGDFAGAVQTSSPIQDSNNRDQLLGFIAKQQATAGDVAAASKLARSIKTASYRAEALAHIATIHKERGQADEAVRGTQEAVRTASESTEDTGTSSLTACASDEPQEPRDAALQRVAETLITSGDIAGALQSLGQMTGTMARENTLVYIAEAQAESGDLAGAQASVAAIKRDSCKAAAANGVARGLFDEGNVSAAIAFANANPIPIEKTSSLTYIGDQLTKKQQFNAALEVLRTALKASELISDEDERVSAMEGIAEAQVRAGGPGEATQTLVEAEPAALTDHRKAEREHTQGGAFPHFVELEAELGDFERAQANLVLLGDSDRTWVVQSAAIGRTKAGDTHGAVAWAESQSSARDKALALVGAANGILLRREPKGR